MSTTSEHVETWLEHIRVLAEDIGPRGSTTEGERRGAEYAEDTMQRLGLSPVLETFTSATSAFLPHMTVGLFMLAAFIVYPLYGQVSAGLGFLLALVGVGSEALELLFHDNVVRRIIPKGTSQNVWSTLLPAGEHKQDLILIGHLDTLRSGIVFSSQRWIDFWRIITPIIFFSFVIQTVLYGIGIFTQWNWIWWVSIESAVCALTLVLICLQAELSPFTPGANDNATAAGLVLTFAEALQSAPLKHTRVWFVNTGCEEVKHYGAIDFFNRHQHELVNPRAIAFEMLGCDGPAWLEHEVIVPPFSYDADPEMVSLLKKIVSSNGHLNGHSARVSGGHTEMADALRVGIPAVTIIGLGPDGTPFGYNGPRLYWHQLEDTFDKMNPDVLHRTYALVDTFIRELDTI